MSTANSYFVNVDSYYRDIAKYPNPTDFGINFASFEGTGTFVQGDPLNANSFFQQTSIDPDYVDNELEFLNATITNSFRTSENLYVAGVFDYLLDFKISYSNQLIFLQTGTSWTGFRPEIGSAGDAFVQLPFLVKFTYDPDTPSQPYTLDWLFNTRPSSIYNYRNLTTKCTFQLTEKGDMYSLFDFSMRNFDFIIYKNNRFIFIGQAANPTIDPSFPNDNPFSNLKTRRCQCLIYIDKSGDVGLVNNHSYGYHIFSSNYNLYPTETNGSFSLETDLGNNVYVASNVNNFISQVGKCSNSLIGFFDQQPVPIVSNNEQTGYVFTNSTGPVVIGLSNIAFAELNVILPTGPAYMYFTLDNPSNPYLEVSRQQIFPGQGNSFLYSFWSFEGPSASPPSTNQFFVCSKVREYIDLPGITGGTGTYIYEVDKTLLQLSLRAVIPTTGSSNIGQCSTGGITYIFNKNPYNYLEVFTFNTVTYSLTKVGAVQVPGTWQLFSYATFDIRGTDIWNFWLDALVGFVPESYYSQNKLALWILRFDTITNTFTYLNYILVPGSTGYGFRVDARVNGKTYLFFISVDSSQLLYYDITDPTNTFLVGTSLISPSLRIANIITKVVGTAVKYYLTLQYVGGFNGNVMFDVTDPANIITVGPIGAFQSPTRGIQNSLEGSSVRNYLSGSEIYPGTYSGLVYVGFLDGSIGVLLTQSKSPLEGVSVTSTHYNQNLSNTFLTPAGATRAQCFVQNDVQYLIYASFSALTIYDVSSIRSAEQTTTIPLGLPATTMYDFKTIRYNESQYFFIAALGYIFGFILLPDFSGIIPVGLYSAAEAFAQIEASVWNNQLIFIASTYGSCRLYKFIVAPSITFQQFIVLEPGKIPGMFPICEDNVNNRSVLFVTTTNLFTNVDLVYIYNIGNFGITLIKIQFFLPGCIPRAASKLIDPRDQLQHLSYYGNIGIVNAYAAFGAFFLGGINLNYSTVTFQTTNFSLGLNAFTRYFYTDHAYMVSNKYGGPGTSGDYFGCLDMKDWGYDVQTMDQNIKIAGTGPYPAYVFDMNLSQLGNQVTCVNILSNGYTYLYDLSNPSYAGKYQTLSPSVNSATNPSFSLGSSFISKLDQEGNQQWIARLSNYQTGTNRASEMINIANVKITKDNLGLYVCGGYKNQIQAFPPNSTGPNCRITSYTNLYNGFLASLNTIDGSWNWLLPIEGANDDYVQKLQYNANANTVAVVGYTSSDNLIVYQRQLSGNLSNPTIPQLNIVGSTNNTNSFMLNFNAAGSLSWYTNMFSNVSTSTVNVLDIGYDNGVFVVTGLTNSSLVECTDSTLSKVQTLYTQCETTNQYAIFNYYFNSNGTYLRSQYIQLPYLGLATLSDSKIYSSLNLSTFCPTFKFTLNSLVEYYNKDGTLGERFTGPVNSIASYVVDYKNESRYLDQNVYYSSLKLAEIPPPYAFTGGEYINYSLYVLGVPTDTTLNKSFSVRNNLIASTEDYRIILNNSIDTSKIVRLFPGVNSITGSNNFFSFNLSSSPLFSMISYNIADQPTVNNTITVLTGLKSNSLSSSSTYYITIPKDGEILSLQVLSFSVDVNDNYVLTLQDVNDLRITPLGPFYGPYVYLTEFNQSVYYTLQFFPSNITTPVFFFVQLDSLVLPNRPLRVSSDERFLSDMPYIYLALYAVNNQDQNDDDIVNIVFDNNPNRERIAIFQLNTVNAGDTSNFVTYNTTVRPKIKFVPNFNTLRVTLFDCYGNVILFDNTPYKPSDSRYTGGVVSTKLMRMTIRFYLQKI
jgi:hypothetical protein